MEMLAGRSAPAPKNAMPRWWMAPHYDALLKDEAGLAWQLRGSGVQTLTEDGYLTAAGAEPTPGREDPLAKKWAAAMTSHYDSLAKSLPVFAELRNCIDLAVVARAPRQRKPPRQGPLRPLAPARREKARRRRVSRAPRRSIPRPA